MDFITRLSIRHRFALLGLIALIAVALPTIPFVREAYRQAETAQWEADSAQPVETLLKAIQLTQQHRGLSALVRGGDASAEPRRAAKQREADDAYAAMTRLMQAEGLGEEPRAAWRQAAQDWAALRERVSGGSISVPDAFARTPLSWPACSL